MPHIICDHCNKWFPSPTDHICQVDTKKRKIVKFDQIEELMEDSDDVSANKEVSSSSPLDDMRPSVVVDTGSDDRDDNCVPKIQSQYLHCWILCSLENWFL